MSKGPCLGDLVAAVVDGELDHAARERAHRHLAHCPACRADVDAQRRLKSRLSGTGPACLSDGLTARLLGLSPPVPSSVPPTPEVRRLPTGPARPAGRDDVERPRGALADGTRRRPPGVRGPESVSLPSPRLGSRRSVSRLGSAAGGSGGLGSGRRVSGRPVSGRRARRLGVGSAMAVAGLGVVLALGGPQPVTTPVDPGTDAFVAEFVSTTGGVVDGATRAGLTGGDRGSR